MFHYGKRNVVTTNTGTRKRIRLLKTLYSDRFKLLKFFESISNFVRKFKDPKSNF